MKRIFVTGFPHSGTTILRAKLGEGENVYEQTLESSYPLEIEEFSKSNKEFYLWKRPFLPFPQDAPTNFLLENGLKSKPQSYFKDDNIVFIIRNPYFAFSSIYKILKKEFGKLKATASIINDFNINFIPFANLFLEGINNSYPKTYFLYYEKLFKNDFQNLKNIMDQIGINYSPDMFTQHTKFHQIGDINSELVNHTSTQPEHYIDDPGYYRTWQLNQPFTNFNDPSKLDLPQRFIDILDSSEIVRKLGYTNPYKQ